MFIWVTLPKGIGAISLFEKTIERKIAFVPGDPFYVDIKDANTMRLNYTSADCDVIDEGIHRLGDLLKEL